MVSIYQQRLDAFLKTAVAPMLRELGFARSGGTWRRAREDAVQVLSIEGDRWNVHDVGRFSCVGALWFAEVARRLGEPDKVPGWWACHVRWYEPGGHELDPAGDLDALARDVQAELRRILHWLDRRTSLRRAWRGLPKPPRCPPTIQVVAALREIAGRRPLARRTAKARGRARGA